MAETPAGGGHGFELQWQAFEILTAPGHGQYFSVKLGIGAYWGEAVGRVLAKRVLLAQRDRVDAYRTGGLVRNFYGQVVTAFQVEKLFNMLALMRGTFVGKLHHAIDFGVPFAHTGRHGPAVDVARYFGRDFSLCVTNNCFEALRQKRRVQQVTKTGDEAFAKLRVLQQAA